MIGAMMRAREQRIENHEKNLLQHAENILKFQQNMESLAQKMLAFSNRISNTFILKPFAYTITNIVVGVTKSISCYTKYNFHYYRQTSSNQTKTIRYSRQA